MRSARHFLFIPTTLALLVVSARADFVVLKSGERVEGKIEEETAKTLTIQVQISPSISDDRVIQKSDIARMSKTTPDEAAFEALINIQPGPNSLSSAQYAQIIAYLKSFVTKYPKSPHAAEVQGTIKGFEAEKKRVDEGEVKMNGDWLDKEQAQIQRVQVEGVFAYENMKSLSASGNFIGALDYFVQIEKVYTGTRTYPEAIELAKQILVKMGPLVENAIVNEQINKKSLEKGWQDAGPKDRKEMMESYQRDQEQAEASAKAAEQAGGWPPFRKDSEKCLKALQTKIGTEYTRLLGLKEGDFRKSVELSDQAARQITGGQNAAANAALKQALALWPANEAAKRLEAELSQIKAAPATPAPLRATSTPRATSSKTAQP